MSETSTGSMDHTVQRLIDLDRVISGHLILCGRTGSTAGDGRKVREVGVMAGWRCVPVSRVRQLTGVNKAGKTGNSRQLLKGVGVYARVNSEPPVSGASFVFMGDHGGWIAAFPTVCPN